jgi:hypothetical protein
VTLLDQAGESSHLLTLDLRWASNFTSSFSSSAVSLLSSCYTSLASSISIRAMRREIMDSSRLVSGSGAGGGAIEIDCGLGIWDGGVEASVLLSNLTSIRSNFCWSFKIVEYSCSVRGSVAGGGAWIPCWGSLCGTGSV